MQERATGNRVDTTTTGTGVNEGQYWWCRKHDRVETEHDRCKARHLLGPYDSAQAARNWREMHEAREERWEEQDEEWEDASDDDEV